MKIEFKNRSTIIPINPDSKIVRGLRAQLHVDGWDKDFCSLSDEEIEEICGKFETNLSNQQLKDQEIYISNTVATKVK